MNEIFIYDIIGDDAWGFYSANRFLGEIAEFKGKPITIRINSPGGEVDQATAIYNAMRRHSEKGSKVTVEVDALAASAASHIAMAGDVIRMAENSRMMIHATSTMAWGNASDMEKVAELLRKYDTQLIDVYASRTGQTREKIKELVDAETWLTASEAVELGLADALGTPLKVAACVRRGMFQKTPEELLTGVAPLQREEKREHSVNAVREQIRIARARMGV